VSFLRACDAGAGHRDRHHVWPSVNIIKLIKQML